YDSAENSKNLGLGQALKKGFLFIVGNDIGAEHVVTLDSDHQHDFSELIFYLEHRKENDVDMLLIRRDLVRYPALKKLGNNILSCWASILTGQRFFDVETGFRIMSVSTIRKILPFFRAYRYSCASEVAIIACMLGLKVDNTPVCNIRYYKSNTSYSDAFTNFTVSFLTYLRMRRKT
ncbi:MAG: glycosyltransferase family 2 protein, partial [Candidatus Muiribacteriaceae bacterium]